jgi:ABC-2 type transport system permease protein
MKQIFLILHKEFSTRVKKRSFLIATLLTPILLPLFLFGVTYMGVKDIEKEQPKEVLVLDESGLFDFTVNSARYYFTPLTPDQDAKAMLREETHFAYLHIPPMQNNLLEGVSVFSLQNLTLNDISEIKVVLESQWRSDAMERLQLDPLIVQSLDKKVDINLVMLGKEGDEKTADAAVTFGVAYVLSFLIYMFVLIYGAQVMQGVIEEKTGKIVEIMLSIVKPFSLMMGKVMGVAAVGLFQFAIWVLMLVLIFVGISFWGITTQGAEGVAVSGEVGQGILALFISKMQVIKEIPFLKIGAIFLFYFAAGFMLYGAFFAAIGSAVESAQDAQQFVFPVTMPMILSLIGSMSFVMQNPSGTVSFWLSIFPLTAPVSMVARISFGVPLWELLLSMSLLVLTTLAMLWVAGKIFRIGLLTQGGKVSFKQLAKWVIYGS